MAELHPVGLFDAMVLDHGFRESKKSGTLSLNISFQTEHGTLYTDLYLTEKAAEKTIEKLRAIGWQGDDLSELKDGTAMRGMKCKVTVSHETYEGTVRARVDWINDQNYTGSITHDDEAAVKARMFNAIAKKIKKQDSVPF